MRGCGAGAAGRHRRRVGAWPLLTVALMAVGRPCAAGLPSPLTIALPERPVYGRIAAPLPERATATIVLRAASRDGAVLRLLPGSPRRLEARSARGTALWSVPVPSASTQLEFSNDGGVFRVYTDRLLLGALTNAPPFPSQLAIRWPGAQPRVSLQRLSAVNVSDDFMREQIGRDDSWFALCGYWRSLYDVTAESTPNPFVAVGQGGPEPAILQTGYLFWNNLRLGASLQPEDNGAMGLAFACRDSTNYLAVLVARQPEERVSLLEVRDNEHRVLATVRQRCPARRWSRLEVCLAEGRPIIVLLDGSPVLTGPSDRNTFGKAGLISHAPKAQFDDFAARSWPDAEAPVWPLVGAVSRQYAVKESTPAADNGPDAQLFRWARDTEAWQPFSLRRDDRLLEGRHYRFPMCGDFDFTVPTNLLPGAILLRDWRSNEDHVYPVGTGRPAVVSRRGGVAQLDGARLEELPPGAPLLVGYSRSDGPQETHRLELRCGSMHQELFDRAPVDWLPIDGTWEIASRWQCKPEWKFFSGYSHDAAILMSRLRFEGHQVHEFHFALKDLFAREYNADRYARHDINFSFCTDGRDLFSGYTVMYGGFANRLTALYRGRECVATNLAARFPPASRNAEARIYDQHLFWRRMRVERLDNRIRAFLEERLLFDYADPAPLPAGGGHVALWTYRNGVMWARLDSSAERVVAAAAECRPAPATPSGPHWAPLDPDHVNVGPAGTAEAPAGAVKVTNLFGGGVFAVRHALPVPIDLTSNEVLRLWVEVPAGVKIDLHYRVNERYLIHTLTAPTNETYRVLGDLSSRRGWTYPEWQLYVCDSLGATAVCGEPAANLNGWIEIDLLAEARRQLPQRTTYLLKELVVGNSSHADYLQAGLGGNAAGAAYSLGPPQFLARKRR